MAIHQNVQDKLFEELRTVFKTATEEVTDDHLDQLPYLEMAIRESLRFWAMVPISARTAMEDIKIGKNWDLNLVTTTVFEFKANTSYPRGV